MTLCESCACYPCCCGGERKTMDSLKWALRATYPEGMAFAIDAIKDAADEIDRLAARVAELEAALKLIAAKKHPEQEDHPYQEIARAALGKGE